MAGGQEQGQRTGMGARPCAFSSQYTVRNVMTSVERRKGTRHLGVIGMEADKALAALREVLADVRGTMKLISPWSRLAAEAGLNGRLLVARDKLAEAIILPLELLQPTDMQLRCFFRLITACSCGSRELVWGSASYVLWQSPRGTRLQRAPQQQSLWLRSSASLAPTRTRMSSPLTDEASAGEVADRAWARKDIAMITSSRKWH